MNRRAFFARSAGAFVAAVALTLKAPERVVEWRGNPGPDGYTTLTFKGKPIVFDAHLDTRATYVFKDAQVWRLHSH